MPPTLWGTSGHLQTAHHAMVDKRPGVEYDKIKSRRFHTELKDGSIVSYDVFDSVSELSQSTAGMNLLLSMLQLVLVSVVLPAPYSPMH